MVTTTPLDLEIRVRLERVISGAMTLGEFYRWFVPATWEVELTGQPEAIRLTHEVAHLLNELSLGDVTTREMKRRLEVIAGTYVLTPTPWNCSPGPVVTTSSATDLTTESSQALGSVFGRPLELARG